MPNAAQKKWMETVANWYQCHGFSDNELNEYQFQIHHCLGRKAKHNKVAIGHWFVLPLPIALHDVSSNHALNITHHKHAFTERFELQSELFQEMIESMRASEITLPFDINVINAIMDTRK